MTQPTVGYVAVRFFEIFGDFGCFARTRGFPTLPAFTPEASAARMLIGISRHPQAFA